MWMKKAEFGLGNMTIVGSCSNALRNTNPRGRVPMQHPSVGRGSHSIFMLGNRLSMSKLTDLHGNV